MKICPKCKNEYRDGVIRCADCDCELVDVAAEEKEQKALVMAPYPNAVKIKEYLEYCDFADITVEEPDEEGISKVFCREEDYKDAYKQVQVYLQEEMKRAVEEQLANLSEEELEALKEEESEKVFTPSNVYQNYELKAAENKSSAYSFLVVGILGVILVVLSWFEMIPFSIGGSGNWFSHSIVLAIFVIFIGIGIASAKSVKKYKALAGKEADDQSALLSYLEESITVELLAEIEADTEEEAYFKRMSFMREKVAETFAEASLDSSFVESLLDAHYDKLFG